MFKWFLMWQKQIDHYLCYILRDFPSGSAGKEFACKCRRHKKWRFDPWGRRSPGGGNRNPLQYSCLKNPMDRGAWQAIVQRVTKSWTWLSKCIHMLYNKKRKKRKRNTKWPRDLSVGSKALKYSWTFWIILVW